MRRGLALLALVATHAGAADPSARWYVQVDNDVVAAGDRWYTSGVRIARVASTEGVTRIEWGLLQEVYTPEAERWAPGIDDRAPAARLLGYWARHCRYPDVLDTVELAAGVRGPSALGRKSTDAVHKLVPAPKVDWSREEDDRLDAHAGMTRSHSLDHFHAHYGGIAGNQIAFAHAGLEWRVGSGAARNAYSPAMRFVATPPPDAGETSWGAFLGASVRGVARNAMLKRNYDAFGPEISPRRAIGRAAGGVTLATPWGSATAAVVWDTREFDAQREPHAFGSFTVHVEF